MRQLNRFDRLDRELETAGSVFFGDDKHNKFNSL